MTDSPTLTAAHQLHDAGLSVIPVLTDGTKAPAVTWTPYMRERASPGQIDTWFASGHPALGVVCGTVSGHLEMLEFEGRAVTAGLLAEYTTLAADHGLTDVWQTMLAGYLEQTPSGGIHVLYRVADGQAAPNAKLARRPATAEELADKPREKVKALVETRGEGGFVVVAPTTGQAHDTGRPWTLLAGGPATITTITAEQRDALYAVATMLDEMPAPVIERDPTPLARPTAAGGTSPGDDYNARATWEEILTPHGWRPFGRRGDVTHWTRPDKRAGTSATTGHGDRGDYLYVFTSSTELPSERGLSKFATYTHLEHGGDFTAAAKALKAAGYGQPAATATLRVLPAFVPQLDGTAALDQQVATVVEHEVTLTDDGNAQLLVAQYADVIRYVPERGKWLTWAGHRWTWDDAGAVIEHTKATIRGIRGDTEAAAKHRTRSLSRRAIEAAAALARTDPAIVVPAASLDADREALCTPAGVVNLRTGALQPAGPEALHTRSTATAPDPTCPTPRWTRFLEQTFGADKALIRFVQRLAGYSATGLVTHHVLPFLHGPGGNGKSVFLDVQRSLLGDYAATAPAAFLMAGQLQHETEVARLAGLRLVICSEVNQESRFDEAKVKILTGGDAITARFMRQDHFTFEPTHHLWLMGNHQPRVSAGGESFWRRLRLVPFLNTVRDEDKDENLARYLIANEGPGILAWIVAGAADALADGLAEPPSVLAATRVYAEEEDALARFVDDCCRLGGAPHVKLDTAELRGAYVNWCRDEGERELSPQVLGRELRSRFGLEQTRSHGRRYYLGVALVDRSPDRSPDEDRSPGERYR